MPEELEGTKSRPDKSNKAMIKKHGADNWYDWRVSNWGTKWDVTAELTDETDESLVYDFPTAWSPPISWLKKVSRDYPKLSFRLKYDEPNMEVVGVIIVEKGKVETHY